MDKKANPVKMRILVKVIDPGSIEGDCPADERLRLDRQLALEISDCLANPGFKVNLRLPS